MTPLPRLYGIADAAFGDPVEIAAELFSAGVRLIQIRNKNASSRCLLEQAGRIVACAPERARVVVNDRADIARLSGAGAVHLGQEDLPPADARRIVGDSVLVGISTHNEEQALAGAREAVDYIAVGPIFETPTKWNASPAIGTDRLRRICQSVDLPVVAIGGIGLSNLGEAFDAGASSVAVISDLIGRGEIQSRAREFLNKLETLRPAYKSPR